MKTRIVQGGIGSYEVQIKQKWYLPWQTVYDGGFPFRGSLGECQKLVEEVKRKYG